MLALAGGVVAMADAVRGDRSIVAGPPPADRTIGEWRHGSASPFPIDGTLGGVLSDGRIILAPIGALAGPSVRGAIYDPAADTWDPLPSAPLPTEVPPDGGQLVQGRLARDRMAVVSNTADGALHAAVFDVASGAWITAPDQTTLTGIVDAVAWDGETLVLVRTQPGGPAVLGGQMLDAPTTVRWSLGDDAWEMGQPFPLQQRAAAGAYVSDGRLVVWGGTTENALVDPIEPGHPLSDGAVYDIAADRWELMPGGPLRPGRWPVMADVGGRLVIGSSDPDQEVDPSWPQATLAGYDIATATWVELPPAPDLGPQDSLGTGLVGVNSLAADQSQVLVRAVYAVNEPVVVAYDGSGAWEPAPYTELVVVGDLVVSLRSETADEPDTPFAAQVRTPDGVWHPTPAAPFLQRDFYAAVAVGEQLIILGGRDAASFPGFQQDVWILDLS